MKREKWSGKIGFILAAAGSAIGLGNLWKFPYITWSNGGGWFVIVYLLCIIIIGLPIMLSELALGKLAGKDAVGTFKRFAKPGSPFRLTGFLGVLGAFTILSYYSVVAGWSIQYTLQSLENKFDVVPDTSVVAMLKTDEGKKFIRNKALVKKLEEDKFKLSALKVLGINKKEMTQHSSQKIYQLLEKKKLLVKWQEKAYQKTMSVPGSQAWRQKAFLPHYSSYLFTEFLSDQKLVILWHTLFFFVVLLIVIGGIKNGIETASKILMPLLLCIMLFMVYRSMSLDSEGQTLQFLFKGDISKLKPTSFLEALGHAFFTLSLGMGAMMTYGSYMSEKEDVFSNSLWVVGADTLIALLACLMIYPIIFVNHLNPTSGGIGILFTTLPFELFKLPFGTYLCLLFYLLVFFAALTSAIALLEVVVTYFIDEFNFSRAKATIIAGLSIWLCGLPSAIWSGFLDGADYFASNWLLPLGGLAISIFVGYKFDLGLIKKEFQDANHSIIYYYMFRFSIRYVTPLFIGIVFIYSVIPTSFRNQIDIYFAK